MDLLEGFKEKKDTKFRHLFELAEMRRGFAT
jgi:hypothetical protein